MFGLPFGALLSAVLGQYAGAPFRLTYVVLTVGFAVLAAVVAIM